MGRPKNIDKEIILRANERFNDIKEGKLCIQLRGIIAFEKNSAKDVAKILMVNPRSIFRWVKKFKENDIDGLKEKTKGHNKSKLTEQQKMCIKKWIINGKKYNGVFIHWTLQKLKLEVYTEFNIAISTTALWKHLQEMGLAIKRPRPIHYKSDKKEQEEFKKKLKKI